MGSEPPSREPGSATITGWRHVRYQTAQVHKFNFTNHHFGNAHFPFGTQLEALVHVVGGIENKPVFWEFSSGDDVVKKTYLLDWNLSLYQLPHVWVSHELVDRSYFI
jgi:hypothetical protein